MILCIFTELSGAFPLEIGGVYHLKEVEKGGIKCS